MSDNKQKPAVKQAKQEARRVAKQVAKQVAKATIKASAAGATGDTSSTVKTNYLDIGGDPTIPGSEFSISKFDPDTHTLTEELSVKNLNVLETVSGATNVSYTHSDYLNRSICVYGTFTEFGYFTKDRYTRELNFFENGSVVGHYLEQEITVTTPGGETKTIWVLVKQN